MQVTHSLGADSNLNFVMFLSEVVQLGRLLWMGKWLQCWNTSTQHETRSYNLVAMLTARKRSLELPWEVSHHSLRVRMWVHWLNSRTGCGGNMDPIFCLILIHAPVSPLASKEQFPLHARVSPHNCSIAICSALVEGLFELSSYRISTEPPSCKDYHYKTAIARRNTGVLIQLGVCGLPVIAI